MKRQACLFALVACALPVASPAAGGGLRISASSLLLSPSHLAGAIRIMSERPYPDVVQVRVYRWGGGGPLDDWTPTSDLLGVPEVFTLPPDGAQTVRIGMRGPVSGNDEKAYRVIVEELPTRYVSGAMAMLMRLNFPVYVLPIGSVEPQSNWSMTRSGNRVSLTLRNTGNVHIRLRALSLVDATHRVIAKATNDVTVLPGESHTWTLQLRASPNGPIDIEGVSDNGTIRANLE